MTTIQPTSIPKSLRKRTKTLWK